jgi:hypothetical protein
VLSRLNPLSYVSFAWPNSSGTIDYSGSHFAMRLSIEALMFVIYGAIAIVKWQRVEA